MYLVTCNRLGREMTNTIAGDYCGQSQLCTPSGDYLIKLGAEETLVTAEINTNTLPSIRKVIGVPLILEMDDILSVLGTQLD